MKTKPLLTLDDARRIAAAAEAEATAHQWNVVIAICDDGGHLLLLHRLDGVAPVSAMIAPAKARAAALGKRETKLYEDMINGGRTSFLSAPLDGMLEGGVPIIVDGDSGAEVHVVCVHRPAEQGRLVLGFWFGRHPRHLGLLLGRLLGLLEPRLGCRHGAPSSVFLRPAGAQTAKARTAARP